MKTIKITTLVAVLMFGHASFAQDEAKGKQNIYTPEQQEILKAQKKAVIQNREEFKASLSDEQLAILKNKELVKKESQEALRVTFTDAQKELLTANRDEIKTMKDIFLASITKEQKQDLKQRKQRMKERIKNMKYSKDQLKEIKQNWEHKKKNG